MYCLNDPVSMADYQGDDAIYVVDYGPNGLPIVGHARLYIQDEEGNWQMTQYTGQFPFPWTANITYGTPKGMYKDELDTILSGDPLTQAKYTYIEGDFSESCKVADSYKGTDYGGYRLGTNNCLHYVREILTYGIFEDSAVETTVYASYTNVPIVFFSDLSIAKNSGILRGKGIADDGEKWLVWKE